MCSGCNSVRPTNNKKYMWYVNAIICQDIECKQQNIYTYTRIGTSVNPKPTQPVIYIY